MKSEADQGSQSRTQSTEYRSARKEGGVSTVNTEVFDTDTQSYSVKGKGKPCYSVKSLADAVSLSIPTAPRRNNKSLFKLCRALLSLDRVTPLTMTDRMDAFAAWYERTAKLGFLRDGQEREHYLAEFLHAMKTANVPLDESPVDAAWRNVQTQSPPAEVELFGFDTEPPKLIVALCYQLDKAAGGKPWYLSCRDAARLVGISYRSAAGWLSGFVSVGLLEAVAPATKFRAVRYRWKGTR